MALWLTLLGTNLFIAGLMLGIGLVMSKVSPPYRPGKLQWTGYRTPLSQKNADTWDFANRYFGRTIRPVGLVALPVTVVAMLPALPAFGHSETFVESWGLTVTGLLVVALLVPAVLTERALRTTFTHNGTRRTGTPRPARARQATRRTRR